MRHELPDLQRRNGLGSSVAEEGEELPQVKLVILAGVLRRVAFYAQIVEESFNRTVG